MTGKVYKQELEKNLQSGAGRGFRFEQHRGRVAIDLSNDEFMKGVQELHSRLERAINSMGEYIHYIIYKI